MEPVLQNLIHIGFRVRVWVRGAGCCCLQEALLRWKQREALLEHALLVFVGGDAKLWQIKN